MKAKYDVVMPTGKVIPARVRGEQAPGTNSVGRQGRKHGQDDRTPRHIKKALQRKDGIHGDKVLRRIPWELEKPRRKHKKPRKKHLLHEEEEALIEMRLGGATEKLTAKTFGVSELYVERALSRKKIDPEGGRRALENQLLHNSLACGERLSRGVEDLNPMQAAVATGIMTSRLLEVAKYRQEAIIAPDLDQLNEIEGTMKELREVVGGSKLGLPAPVVEAEFTE